MSSEQELQYTVWSSVDVALGAPEPGRGLERILGTPVGIGGDVDIHFRGRISGTAGTF